MADSIGGSAIDLEMLRLDGASDDDVDIMEEAAAARRRHREGFRVDLRL